MNTTLAYLRGRRAWLVENLTVWGSDSETDLLLAIVEVVTSEKRVGLWRVNPGRNRQAVNFSDLIDNRGNYLPAVISKPAVMILPQGAQSAFVKSRQGDTGFTIAKNDGDGPMVMVDLMIFETGL
ncbi:MAG: hypothetical protein GY841_05375 [FCB group bacterium]|nr:hypothetical protein [FCB group bacterium]